MSRILRIVCFLVLASLLSRAQESPNFVTYDHSMEEKGNLEISTQHMIGQQKGGLPTYYAPLVELEYGLTGWWSTALYMEGASQKNDASVFTGFRWENRWKPLKSEHKINPILYFEWENINEASRIKKEVVGHAEPSTETLSELRGENAKEIETKLILSSSVKDWTISENFIVEKNLTEDEGFEFGYALGAYRPLATIASGKDCHLCRENFSAGMELYGGLGSTDQFGFKDTAHYLAPGIMWRMTPTSTVKFAPSFGLTDVSDRVIFRIGYTYEINGFGSKVAHLFGAK